LENRIEVTGEKQMSGRRDDRSIYQPELATVRDRKMLNETELYLRLSMDSGVLEYKPGQFVEVSVAGVGEAPFSISSSPTADSGFELVIRKVGNVTNAIHKLQTGDKVGIRGPYGKGSYPIDKVKGKDLIFICGGIGLVPQRSFIKYVLANRKDYGQVTIFFGTKTGAQRFFTSELSEWGKIEGVEVKETVDKPKGGWDGEVGVITTLIDKIDKDISGAMIFACGPPVMYKFVLLALEEKEVKAENIYLNLERKMKCGVGKCGHCQMNNYYVCMDGPVFCYSKLKDIPEAI